MPRLVVLGAGTAGTIVVNRLRRKLDHSWSMTVIDQDNSHHYQPGYLFIPFGNVAPARIAKPRDEFIPAGVDFAHGTITSVDPQRNVVQYGAGLHAGYDWIIIASGTRSVPEAIPGLTDPAIWRKTAHDFYTLDGAVALRDALAEYPLGRIVVHIAEMPIKCPVAPLEMCFLIEDHYRKRGLRHKVDITYVTPLDGAFTKPVAAQHLGGLLDDRSIRIQTDFAVSEVDPTSQHLVGFDGRRIPFDLLITVPPNMGQQFVIDSGLGDESGFIPVDRHTLRSAEYPNMFVLGDATNVPTSKAGAVAHFQAEHFIDNFLQAVAGKPLTSSFDGHANCFVECGRGQALLLDFNYDTEPLTGQYPVPGIGPLSLLKPTRRNHLGKLAFEHLYWNVLLPGHSMPVPTNMSMAGKRRPGAKKG